MAPAAQEERAEPEALDVCLAPLAEGAAEAAVPLGPRRLPRAVGLAVPVGPVGRPGCPGPWAPVVVAVVAVVAAPAQASYGTIDR